MGEMEDFKRPSHPDFLTASELVAVKFSGMRHNSITDDAEIWIKGRVERRVSKAEVQLDPLAINKAIEEVFGLENVMPDSPAARQWEKIKSLKGDGNA